MNVHGFPVRRVWAACVLAVLLPGVGLAQDDAARSLAEAERAFARDAQERLVNDAFLRVLDDSAIIFRPAPVNARASLTDRPMRATLSLVWTPIYAETSADGLLGFDLGPSEIGERGKPPAGTGFFFSVWQRAHPEAEWKLVADCGIAAPVPARPDSAAHLLETRTLDLTFTAGESLADVEGSLINDYRDEFAGRAAADARVFRNGSAPTRRRADAIQLVAGDAPVAQAASRVVVAGSGDLGYVVGVISPGSAEPRGYQRVYRRAGNGQWQVAVDCRP